MTHGRARTSLLLLALFAVSACGESSGALLEPIPDEPPGGTSVPPSTHLRADVFVLRDVATCAVGDSCNQDMRNGPCLELEGPNGNRVGFRLESVKFLPPDEFNPADYQQVQCFRLTIDDNAAANVADSFEELRNRIYRLSGTEIDLDVRLHEVGTMTAGFQRFQDENGIFLPTLPLDANVALASRDTDFTFAVTGERDSESGITPLVDHCAGTIRNLREGLAGAGYTWLTTDCDGPQSLLRHWMFQVLVALRDANGFEDRYLSADGRGHDYPGCGNGANPSEWWPSPEDCSHDPDAPTCGDDRCEGTDDDYVSHVLHVHWPRQPKFVGNHCRNGRTDDNLNENGVDVGGVCDELSR